MAVGLLRGATIAATRNQARLVILGCLRTYCSNACHSTGGDVEAVASFNLDDADEAYRLFRRKFYYNNNGALSSPLFWAARGERTDNRGSLTHPQLSLCDPTAPSSPQNPNDPTEVAEFVYDLGVWLDNMMPRRATAASEYGPGFDRFHPVVNFDLKLINNNVSNKDPNTLVVGMWDDAGFVPLPPPHSGDPGRLWIYVNGVLKHEQDVTQNGAVEIDIGSWNLQRPDEVEAVIEDCAHNRQYYLKAYRDFAPAPYQEAEPEPIPQEEYPL